MIILNRYECLTYQPNLSKQGDTYVFKKIINESNPKSTFFDNSIPQLLKNAENMCRIFRPILLYELDCLLLFPNFTFKIYLYPLCNDDNYK